MLEKQAQLGMSADTTVPTTAAVKKAGLYFQIQSKRLILRAFDLFPAPVPHFSPLSLSGITYRSIETLRRMLTDNASSESGSTTISSFITFRSNGRRHWPFVTVYLHSEPSP
jgi:hypothetical protein